MFETSGELEILRGGFFNNEADKGGVVFASGGSSVTLKDGTSETNEAERSGVVFASDENSITSEGGIFEANEAIMGAAVYVDTGAKVYVEGGNFALNSAKVGGGVLYVGDDGSTEVNTGFFFWGGGRGRSRESYDELDNSVVVTRFAAFDSSGYYKCFVTGNSTVFDQFL